MSEKIMEESLRHITAAHMEAVIGDVDLKYGAPEPGRRHEIEVLAHGLVLVHVDTDGSDSLVVQFYLNTAGPFVPRHNMYDVIDSTWQVRALEASEVSIIREQGLRQWLIGPGGRSNFHRGHAHDIEVVRRWVRLELAQV